MSNPFERGAYDHLDGLGIAVSFSSLTIDGSTTRTDTIALSFSTYNLGCDDGFLEVTVNGGGGLDFLGGSNTDTDSHTAQAGVCDYAVNVCYQETLNG